MPPTVSIIMNCLNCAQHLPAALASVRAQTFEDWEIIFWDNGSTDESAAIAKSFGPKLRYFKSDETTSLGRARNLAIAQAQGAYIAFLDCDDLWKKEKLAKQIALFKANQRLGLACTDTEILSGDKVIGQVFERGAPARGCVFDELVERQWISMSSAMLRKSALDELLGGQPANFSSQWFDERFSLCEEADVFYRVALNWEIDFAPEPLTIWRTHASNTTFRKFSGFGEETSQILAKLRLLEPQFDKKHSRAAQVLEERASFLKAVALWRDGDGSAARKLIAPGLKNSRKRQIFWLASFLPGSLFDPLARLWFALPAKFRK